MSWLSQAVNWGKDRVGYGSKWGSGAGTPRFLREAKPGDAFSLEQMQQINPFYQNMGPGSGSSYEAGPYGTFGGGALPGGGADILGALASGMGGQTGVPVMTSGQTAVSGGGDGGKGIWGRVTGGAGEVWGGLTPMEKAWLVSNVLAGGFDIYSSYKQGQREDKDRKRHYRERKQSADALAPYLKDFMGG